MFLYALERIVSCLTGGGAGSGGGVLSSRVSPPCGANRTSVFRIARVLVHRWSLQPRVPALLWLRCLASYTAE